MIKDTPIIDFHAHVIPHADHGCQDASVLASQLSLMKKHGTDTVVATPHFYPHVHRVPDFISRVNSSLQELEPHMLEGAREIKRGAEVLICEGLDKMDGIEKLCIRGTRLLLLELPQNKITDEHMETVEALMDSGYTVMLAHIDRYLGHFHNEIDALLSIGALAQVNADAVRHPLIMGRIKKYLEKTDSICAFGSDLHGCDKRDYTCFGTLPKAFKEHFGEVMSRSLSLLEDSESLSF